ncbi:MAG TPA: hypothetical protein VGO46_18945 [Gemmatimonadaceae bacterium]|nr:hypothetical protein [Gemmatimonadaceae bacterium]
MSARVVLACFFALALLSGCERKPPAKLPDTSTASPQFTPASTPVVRAVVAPSTWDTSAGPVMFVRGNSTAEAYVIFPTITDSTPSDAVHFDSALARNTTVELFQRAGGGEAVRVGAIAGGEWDADQCIEWPAAKLQTTTSTDATNGWTVAFLKGRARALVLDTVETLPHADSAKLAADITRLVSTVPNDTARTFRGIPYSVRTAYRFTPAPGIEAVVADVVRTLNQEANPLEEHTLIVGERPTGSNAAYRLAYREVTAGSDETLESSDVLAAVQIGSPSHVDLVLAREGYESNAYALLERQADGSWKLRWTSAHTGC